MTENRMDNPEDDFGLDGWDEYASQLHKWAEARAGIKSDVADALHELVNAWLSLHYAASGDPYQLLYEFTQIIGMKGHRGRRLDYELEAQLREIDRKAKGKSAALLDLSVRRGVEFDTLKRHLARLRAADKRWREARDMTRVFAAYAGKGEENQS